MILNLGCGSNKIKDCINVDLYGTPDVRANILHLPFKDSSVDKIYFFHVIEHIEKKKWHDLFCEFHRVMKDGGILIISYPEFIKCAQGFIENRMGKREFFEQTIYGRQCHPGDYHHTLMYTPYFKNTLLDYGFEDIKSFDEPKQDFNTVIKCKKGIKPLSLIERYTRDFFAN